MGNDDQENTKAPDESECSAPDEVTGEATPASGDLLEDEAAMLAATVDGSSYGINAAPSSPDQSFEGPAGERPTTAPPSGDTDEIPPPDIGTRDFSADPSQPHPADTAEPNVGAVARSPALAAVMDAVSYTNKAVLTPPQETQLQMGAKTLADQSAAMLVEDVRAFAQGIEQILIPATAQALAKALADDEKPLKAIEAYMPKLAEFVGKMTDQAVHITTDFK